MSWKLPTLKVRKLTSTRDKPNKMLQLAVLLLFSCLILNINAGCLKGADYYFDETWCSSDADEITPYKCEDEC